MTTETLSRLDGPAALAAIRNGALLIDVRGEAGRHRDGEVHEAVIVPKTDVVNFATRIVGLKSPQQKIVIYCTSIKGSEPIVAKLQAAGLGNVFDVEGGFAALLEGDGLRRIERAKPQT